MYNGLQGGSTSFLQGGGGSRRLQGSNSVQLQAPSSSTVRLQPSNVGHAVNQGGSGRAVLGAKVVSDSPNATFNTNPAATAEAQAAAAAAAKAAADAQRAGVLRGEITNLVNSVKDIFNQRYGQVDVLAGEQSGKLNERFKNESQELAGQVTAENEKIGAAHAAGGVYESSYRGNNVDTVTRAGENQARELGTELQENIAKIAQWVAGQKGSFDAEKGAMDTIQRRLAEEADPDRLTDLRNSIDAKITQLRGGAAEYNSAGKNAQALASIAPSSARAVQLKTTLSQIIAGNADKGQKAAFGQRLISSAGLNPDEAQKLLMGFQSDLESSDRKVEQTV